MTVALEVRIGDLLPEFFANTLIILCPFQAAGAITTGTLQSLFHHLHHFFILVESDCQNDSPLFQGLMARVAINVSMLCSCK